MQLLGASNNKATCHSSCGINTRTRATAAVAARSRQCAVVSVQAQCRAQHQQQQQQHQQRSSPPSRKPTTPRAMAETAADAAAGAGAAATASRRSDPSCQANVDEIVEVSRHYELDVDFDRRVVEGYARITAEARADGVTSLVLDTRGLEVARAELLLPTTPPARAPLKFTLGAAHKALGTPLDIKFPVALRAGERVEVGVRFATAPDGGSTALQFLEPAMTAGGAAPFLFSQCQAIHARSLVPCQDTPGVKAPVTAAVRAPAGLTALMSAVPVDGGGGGGSDNNDNRLPGIDGPAGAGGSSGSGSGAAAASDGGRQVFRFSQAVAVPSYLIALAVGRLASRDLSARCRVWAEPEAVEAAAYEFAETETFLAAAEAVAGDYVWGRYDLLLLPPSFPYGGMENPCLTFVTPTLIAGDRSLTNVVAHEIAHSWSGNLVTNASWADFWLNEGWTVFLERKILGRVRGEPAAQFSASCGARQLSEEVARIGPDHNYTRLVPQLTDDDPDDAFSRIPYEKGFHFLYYLQALVGGPDAFEPFIKAYLEAFAHRTVTSAAFRAFFEDYFRAPGRLADATVIDAIDWDAWLHATGMPPVANAYDTSLAAAADALAVKWHTADVMGVGGAPPEGASASDIASFSSEQTAAFLARLNELRSATPMSPKLTRAMAELYGFDAAANAEIKCEWLRLCVLAGDDAALPAASSFLKSVGRMKYLRPLYRALLRSRGQPAAKDVARATFAAAKKGYHPIAAKMVAADLGELAE